MQTGGSKRSGRIPAVERLAFLHKLQSAGPCSQRRLLKATAAAGGSTSPNPGSVESGSLSSVKKSLLGERKLIKAGGGLFGNPQLELITAAHLAGLVFDTEGRLEPPASERMSSVC